MTLAARSYRGETCLTQPARPARPRVVIIGAGFGGIARRACASPRERRHHAHRQNESLHLPQPSALSGCDSGHWRRVTYGANTVDTEAATDIPRCCWRKRGTSTPSGAWFAWTTICASFRTIISSWRRERVTIISAATTGSLMRRVSRLIEDASEIRRRFLLAYREGRED